MGWALGQCLVWLLIAAQCMCVWGQQVEVIVGDRVVNTGTGWNSTLAVATVGPIHSVEWTDPAGSNILTRIQDTLFIKPGTAYSGRVALLTNGSLAISSTRRSDQGTYTVKVDPLASTALTSNSITLSLMVHDPVEGVSVSVSMAAVREGMDSLTLRCSQRLGSGLTYTWLKSGAALVNSSRLTVTPTLVSISPVDRTDAGNYTCRVSNPVSAGQDTQAVIVYYGPESLTIARVTPSDCVTSDQVAIGQPVRLTCGAVSVPPATYTWTLRGRALVQGTTVIIPLLMANGSGTYTCRAVNGQTGVERNVTTLVTAVGVCLSAGAVAGIVIGAVAFLILLILLILLIVCLVKRRRQKEKPLPKKQPVVNRSNEVEAKVRPWLDRHQQQNPGFNSAGGNNLDRGTPYTPYPPSLGSMVPSTFNGGSGSISVTQQSIHISTLV